MRCVVIGENSLLAECTGLLLGRGHQVVGLVSDNPELRQWAQQREVPAHSHGPELASVLGQEPFDYLFSITNLRILPQELLDLPGRLAVNFHDALLPRHAGMYATSWALLDCAQEHGVTWHVMTEEADAGDILAQRAVPVLPTDTAYSLNTKCFQAGIASFTELVDDLAADRVLPVPQDLRDRTYHARADLIPDAGVLRFSRPAGDLHALVRATEFGPHPNGLGSAKLFGGGEIVLVGESVVTRHRSGQPPGTIVAMADEGLTVAAADADLTLRRLSTPEGAPLSVPELAARWHIEPGHRLPGPDPAVLDAVLAESAAVRPHEPFWVRRLATMQPLDLPYGDPLPSRGQGWHDLEIHVPPELGTGNAGDPAEVLLTAVLAFLARTSGGDRFDVGLRRRQSVRRSGAEALFAAEVPLRVTGLKPGLALADLCATVSAEFGGIARRNTYLRDVWARYPRLRDVAGRNGLPLVVDMSAGVPRAPRRGSTALVHVPPGGGRCRWLVSGDAVGEEAAAHFRNDIEEFLQALAEAPEDVLAVPLLPTRRRQQVIEEWNDTARAYPRDTCVTRLVAEQARRRPTAAAVTDDTGTLSYRELEQRSNQVASALDRAGVGRGDRVGVHLRRSADLVAGLLGVLKTGAAYVPLDPAFPAKRIRYMIDDAGVSVVLSQAELASALDPDVRVVRVDETRSEAGAQPFDRASADDPAYVIYTSGSTGRPKGVQVGHRALTNFLCAMAAEPGCTEADRLLAVTTVCFDIAGLELYLPLVTGACVDVVPENVTGDGFALRDRIERSRPTVMQATPATWRMLIAAGWAGDARLRILCGGEALPADLVPELTTRAKEVWNLYGPTETTIWSAVSRVLPGRRITVGRPIANTRFYVLDRWGRPVPPCVPGELYIGGDGVADGYLGMPELTAQRFVPDGFFGSGVLYRTGDLVRYLPDGTVEYLNRVDDQVKVHGHRIELGEIEAILNRHPEVAQAVAVVREDMPGDRRLAAYVVPSGSELLKTANLRAHLARELPSYMVPALFAQVARIPLTQNGKVDRAALPVPGREAADGPTGPAPRTGLEEVIAAAWRSSLLLEQFGVDDNFFDVGGNSLLVGEVVKLLREELALALTALDMFQHPTIRTMARHLDAVIRRAGTDPAVRPGRRIGRTMIHQRRRGRRPLAD
ncbi:amino acid adenylation domain-containing protein [Streptomyces sp. NBC_00243]|uniref:amino acid adenylation domain-containing protein n=1 Tax=Streptomyces sp. NBC_00243 TaxID=2975688 RepID=UPI002DDA54DC|nr:amino acid adenylation domain-containing protein [Streptomyces sp. NBC_00243]WRZ17352.1 amino acid adenylation domain-containing protein [Streptomyces sp. NBC_00243]